ncbi:hypothetical protein DOT_3931 [Desulfosporosinus sp. OT]|nr:hypothetical protein DOT_3931 [Desulfosporosinus sp. OT]
MCGVGSPDGGSFTRAFYFLTKADKPEFQVQLAQTQQEPAAEVTQ